MFSYTDTILSIMQRIEVYNEIFKAISKEVQEYGCNQAAHRRGRDTYMFCRNNVNRFFTEEMMFRKNLEPYYDKEATKILLEGLINQACKEACEGIQSAHSVHKM